MGVQAIKHAALLRAWSGRIAECRSSGKTVKAWCEAEGVSIRTYYYWEKRIVAEASQEAKLRRNSQNSFKLADVSSLCYSAANHNTVLHLITKRKLYYHNESPNDKTKA